MTLEDKTQEEYDEENLREYLKLIVFSHNIFNPNNEYFSQESDVVKSLGLLFHAYKNSDQFGKFDSRFDIADVLALFSYNIRPEAANKADKRLNGHDIVDIVGKCNLSIDFAEGFDERFDGNNIGSIAYSKVSSKIANQYPSRFDGVEICGLIDSECPPEVANQYDKRFHCLDIISLFQAKVPPEEAVRYLEKLDGTIVSILYSIGLKPDNISKVQQLKFLDLFEKMSFYDDINSELNKFKYIGTGNHALVLLKENSAWKFSINIEYEAELLSRLNDPTNVVKKKGDVKENIAMELEFIKGNSLENVLKKQRTLSADKVLNYSADILNGIMEMREAGLYHRDLHDRNVLIDEEKDRAVIIDLGAATRYPDRIYGQNRTYAGNNDLVSAAQLMYKMATGHHLFKEGPGFTCYSEVKEGIKTERERAYEDRELLESYFSKVRTSVKGDLGEFIIKLLDDDLWKQPSLERVQKAKSELEGYLR